MNWIRSDHCSINRRISAIRSWSLARLVGLGDACPPLFRQKRHRGALENGRQLLFLFFQPLRRRDEIAQGRFEVFSCQAVAALCQRVRLAASTMLSISAPESPRPASPAGTAPAARLTLFFRAITLIMNSTSASSLGLKSGK